MTSAERGLHFEHTHRLILVILDGFGINPRKEGNAIANAATPHLDAC